MPGSIEGSRHFFAAVTALATMPDSLVERLGHAYWHCLRHVTADRAVSPEMRTEFAQLMVRLEILYPTPHAREVDPLEAARIAKRIVRLYERMSRST